MAYLRLPRAEKDRIRRLLDQRRRAQIARAHGKDIVTAADRRMWAEAERAEKEQAA